MMKQQNQEMFSSAATEHDSYPAPSELKQMSETKTQPEDAKVPVAEHSMKQEIE